MSVELETPRFGVFSFLMELRARHSYKTTCLMGECHVLLSCFSSAQSKRLDDGVIKPVIKSTLSSGRPEIIGIEDVSPVMKI